MKIPPQGTHAAPAIDPSEPISNESKGEPATSGECVPEIKMLEAGQKKQPSSRKIAANRRNSEHSTGPTTPQGKKRARRNAIKHGFFSRWLVIGDPTVSEDPDECERLRADIVAHYEPVGFEEQLRCEEIVSCLWKLRRLTRYESGQISRNVAEHRMIDRDLARLAEENPDMGSNAELGAITDHLLLLSTEDLDRLSRYHSLINRQLNFAMAELERIQARRKSMAASFENGLEGSVGPGE